MTYLIPVGNFAHVIARSMEAFMLVMNGEAEIRKIVQDFLVPILLGNIAGGAALFALVSHAQVMKEIWQARPRSVLPPWCMRPVLPRLFAVANAPRDGLLRCAKCRQR